MKVIFSSRWMMLLAFVFISERILRRLVLPATMFIKLEKELYSLMVSKAGYLSGLAVLMGAAGIFCFILNASQKNKLLSHLKGISLLILLMSLLLFEVTNYPIRLLIFMHITMIISLALILVNRITTKGRNLPLTAYSLVGAQYLLVALNGLLPHVRFSSLDFSSVISWIWLGSEVLFLTGALLSPLVFRSGLNGLSNRTTKGNPKISFLAAVMVALFCGLALYRYGFEARGLVYWMLGLHFFLPIMLYVLALGSVVWTVTSRWNQHGFGDHQVLGLILYFFTGLIINDLISYLFLVLGYLYLSSDSNPAHSEAAFDQTTTGKNHLFSMG